MNNVIAGKCLKQDVSEESQCHNTATALGKHPHQNNREPSGTLVTEDGTAIKKQKMDSNSEEQEPTTESQDPAVRLGKHHIQHSVGEGLEVKRQKPNEEL